MQEEEKINHSRDAVEWQRGDSEEKIRWYTLQIPLHKSGVYEYETQSWAYVVRVTEQGTYSRAHMSKVRCDHRTIIISHQWVAVMADMFVIHIYTPSRNEKILVFIFSCASRLSFWCIANIHSRSSSVISSLHDWLKNISGSSAAKHHHMLTS